MKINTYICIVGFGSIGKKHFELLNSISLNYNFLIVSKSLKKNVPAIVLRNLKQTNKFKICLALICSPPNIHVKHSEFFIKKNIPIFVEKPFSSNYLNLLHFIKKYKNTKTSIQVGYVFRFHKQAIKLKKMLSLNIIGKLNYVKINNISYLPQWRNSNYKKTVSARKELGGGVLNEMSHEIDYLYWFFGKIKVVKCNLKNFKKLKLNVEDNAYVELTNLNNIKIYVHLNFSEQFIKERNILISGEKGIIWWDILKQKIVIKTKDFQKIHYSKLNLFKSMYENQTKYIIKNLIKNKKKNDFETILNVSKILYNCKLSSRKNKEVKI